MTYSLNNKPLRIGLAYANGVYGATLPQLFALPLHRHNFSFFKKKNYRPDRHLAKVTSG